MKKDKLYEIVAKAIKDLEDGSEIDKQALAVDLMTGGASLAMVNRELPKALAANGIVTDSSSLQVVRDAVKESLEEDEDGYVEVEVNNYDELAEWAASLAEQFNVAVNSCIKVIKTAMGDDAPSRPKLGKVKTAIIAYLVKYPKGNIEGLAENLESECDLEKDKALREARMNYTFAKACFDANK